MNGAVHCGIYGENEGVETVALKWVHEIFGWGPFTKLVKSVFHGEPRRVPDAVHTKRECGGHITGTSRKLPCQAVIGTDCNLIMGL